MNLKEVKKKFQITDIKEGDLGDYAEVYIQPHVYIHVFANPGLTSQLFFNDKFVSFLHGVKEIDDLININKLITNEY